MTNWNKDSKFFNRSWLDQDYWFASSHLFCSNFKGANPSKMVVLKDNHQLEQDGEITLYESSLGFLKG